MCGLRGPAYETGYDIINNKGVGLVPLCPGNGYFKRDRVAAFLDIADCLFDRIELFIPDTPTEHTYRAIGISKPIAAKARLEGNRLINMAKKLYSGELPKKFTVHRWPEIEQHPEYQKQLAYHHALYQSNAAFRRAVQSETQHVLMGQFRQRLTLDRLRRFGPGYIARQAGKLLTLPKRIEIGTPYTLEEFAFVTAAPEMFNADRLAYQYYQKWIMDKFIAGDYDQPRTNLGMVIVK